MILSLQDHFLFAYHQVSKKQMEAISVILFALCFGFISYYYIYNKQKENFLYQNISVPEGFKGKPWYRFTPNSQMKKADSYFLIATLLALILLLISLLIKQSYFFPQWQIIMQDIGQGLSVIIRKDDRAVVYDTGTAWPNGNMAELETIPYLHWQGIQMDRLIVSHDDQDHAGGVNALLKAFTHSQFITSSNAHYRYPSYPCLAGQHWNWRGLLFEVYWPTKTVFRAKNEDSCVIRVSSDNFSFLLTGDIGFNEESQLIKNLPKTDVIQIAHHGSKYSTSQTWLQQLSPKIALISAGRWNPWHHPSISTIARLDSAKVKHLSTSYDGQIIISINGSHYQIESARSAWQPWYRIYIGEK